MKQLRVFHGLVNFGSQCGLFAYALRGKGIDAISVTHPDKFERQTDIELAHGGHFLQKIFRHSWNWIRRLYWFFRYNTFHFYYGTTLFPNQLDLLFYRLFGKKVIMEYLGYDVQQYQYSVEKYGLTNVSYYKTEDEGLKSDSRKAKRLCFESKHTDKQFVCAPYLSEFVPNSTVLPLAVDLDRLHYSPKNTNSDEIVIMHAPTHRGNKGTSFILSVIDKLIFEGYKIKKVLVENISHDNLIQQYKKCDIVIDQVLSGWYGTVSIEAMAIGRPVVCFIRKEYFQYVDYAEKIPIINANPDDLYHVLIDLINNPNEMKQIGERSRQFVEEIHDLKKITDYLIASYKKLWA